MIDNRGKWSDSVNALKVYDVAVECVGGVENSIMDGDWEDSMTPSERELIDMAMCDVQDMCPREVRFLGNSLILDIVKDAVETFEFEFSAPLGRR